MESILRRTEIELETLNPQVQKFSAFSSYAPRRSHLDSASYRSLVRILSRCLDNSLVPPPAPVERTLNVINPTSGHEGGELHLDQVAGASINGGCSMERQEKGDRCAGGGGHEGSLVAAAELVGIDPAIFDDEFEASVNSDLLNRFMSDCERLIDVPNVELQSSGELHEEKVQVGHGEIVDKDLEISKTCINGVVEGVSNLKEVSDVAKGDANSEHINGMPDSDSLIGEPNSELYSIVQSHGRQSGQEEIVDNDLGISNVCVHGVVPRVSNPEEVLKVSKEDANNKLLSRVLPDCNKTIDVPNGELCSSGESHEANEEADLMQIVENGFKITKACFHDAEKGNFNPGEVSTVTKGDANNELLNRFTSDCGRLIDGNGQSVHEEIASNDPEITKASVLGTQEEFPSIVEISEVFKGDGNHVLLNKAILDGSRLIDALNGELQSSAGPHDRNVQAGYEKIMDNDMISKALVYGAKDSISDLGKILEVAEEDELGRIQPNVPGGVHNSTKESEGRRKITGDVGDEKIEVTKQTTYANSPSLMDWSDVRNLEEDQVNTLAHQIDEGCFEEGEIPDEIQDLKGQIDFTDEERVQGPTKIDFKEVASTSIFVHKKDVLEHGTGYHPSTVERRGADVDYEANPSDTSENDSTDEETQKKQMVMNAREKKQRGPLTEERKAKKKIAKKRKRAQKNREQGVKKLKLHTITKPKEVKICNFYLMGRCQQGDLCKYSHDAPLIKSAPCKYFASNSCLKGDDCMFDHELSKYPCHKYVSTGSCIRGDGCKFSHKISTAEASSQLTSGKIESHLTSEPPKLRNQPVRAHASPRAAGPFESNNNKGTRSLGRTPLKEAAQAPKGIRFLSFGAVQTDLNNKVKEKLPVKKSGKNGVYNQQRQDDLFVASSGSAASSNGFAVNKSCNITQLSSTAAPGTVNHEVSEATKILEEFLFCGAS